MRQQIGQTVVAVLTPRARRRTRIAANHHLEFRIRRVRCEIFIGINIEIGGMIDREHAHLIQVNGFLQRLHEAEAESRRRSLVVGRWQNLLPHHSPIDLDVFDRTRHVALAGANPVSNHARAQHIGHKLVTLAVPYKQRGAGTAAAVDLEKVLLLVAGHLDFVLQDARGPQHANDVGLPRVAQADHDVSRVLPQVSVRACDLKLLPVAAREHFHLGADGALVVGQSLERKAQPMVLIAAFIVQQHGGPVILRDQQVGRAVAIVIAGDDGARLFELNLVETNVGGDVFEAIGAKIAEELDPALMVFRLAYYRKINPAVIVIVKRGSAESYIKVSFKNLYVTKTFSVLIAPNLDRCNTLTKMCSRHIHPPIVVKIGESNPSVVLHQFLIPRLADNEFPLAWVFENDGIKTGYENINSAVIVKVRTYGSSVKSLPRKTLFFGHVRKSPVSIVAP